MTELISWMSGPDTGISSKRLATEYAGAEYSGEWAHTHPLDPADLGRCLRLIQRIPGVRPCVDRLAAQDVYWAALAPHWDELAAMMEAEVGINWSKGNCATTTYRRMHEILELVRRDDA